MIKAIIFDFGGVLTVEGKFIPFAKEYAKKFNVDYEGLLGVIIDTWIPAKVNKTDSKLFWERISEYLNYDEDKLRTEFIQYHGFRKDVLKLAISLKKKYKLAILSNQIKDWLEEEIEKHDLRGIFDIIVPSYEVKLSKPDHRIYQLVIDKLGLRPEECVFIDDTPGNIEVARNLGIYGILFEIKNQLEHE